MPRVSVLIPTFNCAQYLGRAINTALDQTYRDIEVIIVDDGSTDETKEVVSQFGGKVSYHYQPNKGLSVARNVTLGQASGEFFAYLDADDMWYPQKLEREVAFLDANPDCGFVHSDISVINEDDEILYRRFNQDTGRKVPVGDCIQDLVQRCHVQILTVLERQVCSETAGNFDPRLLVAQDYFRWIMIASHGWRVGYLDEPLALYRWRKGSLMSNRHRLVEDFEKICHILLADEAFKSRCGGEVIPLISGRLYTAKRELAYLDRIEGQNRLATRRLIELIKRWPLQPELYADLLKACLPAGLLSKVRTLKSHGL